MTVHHGPSHVALGALVTDSAVEGVRGGCTLREGVERQLADSMSPAMGHAGLASRPLGAGRESSGEVAGIVVLGEWQGRDREQGQTASNACRWWMTVVLAPHH